MKLIVRSIAMVVITVGIVLACGCSGVNVSPSVSPASFLLPGLAGNFGAEPASEGGTNMSGHVI